MRFFEASIDFARTRLMLNLSIRVYSCLPMFSYDLITLRWYSLHVHLENRFFSQTYLDNHGK